MPSKKGSKKKKAAADDDWEALLEAEAQADTGASKEEEAEGNAAAGATGDAQPDSTATGQDAAAAFLAAQGLDATGGGGEGKKETKKKKKKKKGGGGGGDKGEGDKVSAKGKLIAERLRKQQEEEERIRALEEAEAKRIADLEAAEEAEAKRIAEEKERKKQKQKEKIERQKREGTYMTKAQKAKAAQAAQRLEAMRAAGMTLPTDPNQLKKRPGYGNKNNRKGGGAKNQENNNGEQEDTTTVEKEEEAMPTVVDQGAAGVVSDGGKAVEEGQVEVGIRHDSSLVKKNESAAEAETVSRPVSAEKDSDGAPADAAEESSGDEWDASSSDDSSVGGGGKFDDLVDRLRQASTGLSDDEEDLAAKEKQKEQERLRQLGLERAERERIEQEKQAALRAEQEELNRRELLVAQRREEGKRKRLDKEKANLAARSRDDLRCPIVVIMGHVDTGKTKLLDKIRKTNVQGGEAGGITQQIGATFFEKKTLEAQTFRLNETEKFELTVPGMLVIDTPGHESFTNLRSRGSSLCDVAILVVDLMHGLEQQTIESLNMLRSKGTPFVVALNKVDRCYAWKTCSDSPIREALDQQAEGTLSEFRSRATDAKVQLQEQGVNSNLYWEMGDDDWMNSDFVPLVPTSAVTGEGVQDILLLLCQIAQRKLWKQMMWCANLQCTVLEVKQIDGLGTTVDVLIVNGYLREGDRAVFCTLDGPIVTEIRGLLTPPPSREMRVKADYIHHKEVKGALGVKLIGNNLEKVMAGTPVMIVSEEDEEEDIKQEVMHDLTKIQEKLSVDKKGLMVQASTLGALEALLQFLREETQPPIPVSSVGIGAITKRDVTQISIMNEKGCSEFATILAFDVNVEREAREHANEMSVRIFTADIIYHLFDQFTRFMEELAEKRREEAAAVAVFPSICKILPQHIFNQKDPIIVGIEVVEGILKVGTPLCIPALGGLHVGKVTSIESNGREQETARKGSSVAVKIVNESNPNLMYGRQFDSTNSLYSTLTRESIDALKANFKDKLENEDWRLVVKLKKVFNII